MARNNKAAGSRPARLPTEAEFFVMATDPLEPGITLEEKVAALCLNLAMAETLNAALKYAIKENQEADTPANRRKPIRTALMAVMEFLIATGIGDKRMPKTLWRLVKGLAELDDSGTVDQIFVSARTGKGARPDTNDARGLKIAAAVATEIAFKDCGWSLDQATKHVERELDNRHAGRLLGDYNAGTIDGWRNKCIGAGEWSLRFREGISIVRDQETTPARRLKRALFAIKRLAS